MKNTVTLFMVLFSLSACNETRKVMEGDATALTGNPFAEESKLPYAAPNFSVIQNAHFKPAILAGIEQQKATVTKIAENKEAPTFENTIVALEKSGELLSRVLAPFQALTGAHTNDTLQAIQEEIAPLLSQKEDFIYHSRKMF